MSDTLPMACPAAGNRLFAALDPKHVDAAVARCSPLDVLADAKPIFETNQPADCIYLIESGHVRIYKNKPNGGQHIFVVLGPGDYFGEMALFSNHRRSACAAAESDCRLWRLPFDTFQWLLLQEPEMNRNLLDNAHERLREIDERYLSELLQRDRIALVGRMAASIVHDFKTPLSGIRGLAELMAEDHPDEENRRRTQAVIREVDRMVSMTHDLLNYCRCEKQLDPKPTLLNPFLTETMDLLREDFARRNVVVKVAVGIAEPVKLDPQRFQRVLYNLALNAAEAMPNGGTLAIRADRENNWARIDISDTGMGVPPHMLEQIWQPFVTFGKKAGTGLGLPIAKKLVEDHGGTISLESELHRGTTFTIRLPMAS